MCIKLYIAFAIIWSQKENSAVNNSVSERKGDHMKDYFEEIIGYEDIKKELNLTIDMMNNQELYEKLGATVEKGIILQGRPGTGKTTMANCIINGTGRKCFTCRKKSSDGKFLEEIVKTFEEARKNPPSIVFLDDMDKFSDKGGEYEDSDAEEFVTIQTCMDEIKDKSVFVLATANKIRKLPGSLLRPGRFGKSIFIRTPTPDESREIIGHYLAKSNANENLDADTISRFLRGESCATLEDVIRRAAAKAAYNRQDAINMDNVIDASLDLVFESPEYDKKYSEDTLRRIAYHEAGHAVVAEILDPGSVSIASIRMSNSDELGFVRYCRKSEEEFTIEYYQNIIRTSLAGRAATELVYGETDLGANNDLHNAYDKAVKIADNFCAYGFTSWIEDDDIEFVGENRNRTVALIMEQQYQATKKIIIENRQLLDRMADELMKRTTLIYPEIQAIMKKN